MKNPRVVVTGLGPVTGFGFGWQSLWKEMINGNSCIRSWRPAEIEGDNYPVRYAAPVNLQGLPEEYKSHPIWSSPMEYRARLGWVAACLAVSDSKLSSNHLKHAAVLTASGAPHHFLSDMLLAVPEKQSEKIPGWGHLMERRDEANTDGSLRQSNCYMAESIAKHFGCNGPVINISSACAGAAQAIGNALHMLRRNEVEVALAGGADSVLNLDTMTALYLLGATSTDQRFGERLCRPFSIDRTGLVAGEGGGFVVLESLDHALARGATIYAELIGYGSSLDGYKVTAPEPTGRGAVHAMRSALLDAQVHLEEIDVINTHGTSTPLNDAIETQAIKEVFKENQHFKQLIITANKSQFGHLIAAAAAPEFIITALSCRYNQITPIINSDNPDPECDLTFCKKNSLHKTVNVAMSNSFGFGGLNCTLVARKYIGEQYL